MTTSLQELLSSFSLPTSPATHFSPEEQKMLYETGYSFYEANDWSRAADIFMQLILSDPFEERYWRGLASSRQMESKYRDAVHAWALVALLAEKDPLAHFHAAECLFSLNEKEEAKKALASAEARNPTEELKGKIELLKRL